MIEQNCILIEKSPGETRAGLVETGAIVELYVERASNPSRLGEIGLVRVTSARKDLGGVFVDAEWGAGFVKIPGAHDFPNEGALVVAEVVKDGAGGKEPALRLGWEVKSANLVIGSGPGELSISRKIRPESRRRQLREFFDGKVPADSNLTVRTSAAAEDDESLIGEFDTLSNAQRQIFDGQRDARKPTTLIPAPSLQARLAQQHPQLETVDISDNPQFEDFGLEDAFEEASAHSIQRESGFRITIDRTEALTAIDVDGAGTANIDAKHLNLAAAAEIARLIRLRRDSGLILIDFLRMSAKASRTVVSEHIAACMKTDPIETRVHGWTRAGLLEITRQRVGPSIPEIVAEQSTDKRLSVETVGLSALRRLINETKGIARPTLICSIGVAGYLASDGSEFLGACERKIGGPIDIRPDPSYPQHKIDIS